MSELDSAAIYERLDSHGLYGRIAGLPAQIEEAWAAARALALPERYREAERIAVLGMGGSGIGGLLLQALAAATAARAPVAVVRGYAPPAFIDGRTLVLASSNSGNTEETLAAFGAAAAAGAMCVVVTTGGRLIEMARERGVPALRFDWDGEPRSALGWSSATLMAICDGLGLVPGLAPQLRPALDATRAQQTTLARDVPETSNPAKQLARRLHGRLPVYVGAEALAPVAYRWRTQTNENAKSWAIADELPEMNHTAHAGYGLPAAVAPYLHAVLLRHASMHPRIRLRVDATADVLRASGIDAEIVEVGGAGPLVQMLAAIHLGDFTTYYLGLLNGVEPAPIVALQELKALLASSQ
jgi:glucose/mannose-6-phosphate isomerase